MCTAAAAVPAAAALAVGLVVVMLVLFGGKLYVAGGCFFGACKQSFGSILVSQYCNNSSVGLHFLEYFGWPVIVIIRV